MEPDGYLYVQMDFLSIFFSHFYCLDLFLQVYFRFPNNLYAKQKRRKREREHVV